MLRGAAVVFVSLLVAACGPGATPQPSVPDDPSTVRVIVFMRDQSGTEVWVDFDTTGDGGSGSTVGATSNVVVACDVVRAGGNVAVGAVPGFDLRVPLYT